MSSRKYFFNKNKQKKQFCRIKKNGRFCDVFMVALIVLALAGMAYYISIVNTASTGGYIINDLQARLDGLNDSNQKLELTAIELKQITRVAEAASNLGMVVSQQVDYLKTGDNKELAAR